MNKFLKSCMWLIIGLVSASAGQWAISSGSFALLAMHVVFASLFFAYIPALIFKSEQYRLASCVVEILLGFMVFSLIYLNGFVYLGNIRPFNCTVLLMFDSVGAMAVSFGGAMLYAQSIKD